MKPRTENKRAEGLDIGTVLHKFGVEAKESLPTTFPPRRKRVGRPWDTSLSSWKQHEKEDTVPLLCQSELKTKQVTDKQGEFDTKSRRLSDLMQVT